MKRVGIITIQSIVNYGNRLQNYAVEQLLRNKNVEVESIRIAEPILWTKIYIKAYTSAFIGGLKNDKECQNRGIRTKKFLAFNEKHLNIKIVRSKKAKKILNGMISFFWEEISCGPKEIKIMELKAIDLVL